MLYSEALLLQLLPGVALHDVLDGEQAVSDRVLLVQHLPGLRLHLLEGLESALLLQVRHELVKNLLPGVEGPFYSDHLSGEVTDFSVQDDAQ